MKTSTISKLEFGDLQNTLAQLNASGVRSDDVAAIGKNEALRADIVAAVMKHRLFTAPEEQIKRLLTINEQWKDVAITETAIRELGDPPSSPSSDDEHLYCVALVADTGDALTTLQRNWAACVQMLGQEATWKWDHLVLTPKGVQPRPGRKPRAQGLRWVVAELGRTYRGRKVKDARPALDKEQLMGMGEELPLIAALHPRWAVSMNGDNIPFVDAPDLEVAPQADGGFDYAPCLSFDQDYGRVGLDAKYVEDDYSYDGSGSLR